MPELRWILIGFAVVLLACIYLWGRRNDDEREERSDSVARARPEPTLMGNEHGTDASQPTRQVEEVNELESAYFPGHEDKDFEADVTLERKFETARASLAARHERSEPTRNTQATVVDPRPSDARRRIEPTFGGDSSITAELPVETEEVADSAPAPQEEAPTLSSADTPTPRRSDRRKILSLRLAAAPHRIEGAKLAEVFASEGLKHGKYEIFHRLHDAQSSIFCVASMVEPGTFDPETMPQTQYTGITMFAQLPGPVPGMHALNELVACARRLQQSLGGTLQDDRGVPLTVHRIERLRQEVREFERPAPATQRGTR